MGAYEYGPPPLVADVDGNELVDALDLFVFQQAWHTPTAPAPPPNPDQNGDRRIDANDLILLKHAWRNIGY